MRHTARPLTGWLAAVGFCLALGGSTTTAFAQQANRPPIDPFARPDVQPIIRTQPPQEKVRKGPDGRLLKPEHRTATASTRPDPAKAQKAAAAAQRQEAQGRLEEPQGFGSQGVKIGQRILSPFGAKGERVSIAFRSGEFMPPVGEKIQPALARLAQERAAHAARFTASRQTPDMNSVYGLILLNGRLTDELKALLDGAGVELLAFYPHAAYQARIPVTSLEGIASLAQVRWIGQPTPDQKIAPELRPFLTQGAKAALQPLGFYVSLYGPDPSGSARAALQAAGAQISNYDAGIAVVSTQADPALAGRLAALNQVFYVEPILPGGVAHRQSMASINADWMWGVMDPLPPGSSRQVKIGMMDTGLYVYHNDVAYIFGGLLGYSLIAGEDWWNDLHGHGTHVSGTILGSGAANYQYRGVAASQTNKNDPWNNPDYLVAQVWNQFGSKVGNSHIQGLEAMNGDYNAAYKRHVFNMSGGNYGQNQVGTDAESRKVDAIFQNDVLPVIAAGNEGSAAGWIRSPGVAKGALTVGAIQDDDYPFGWSGQTDEITGYSSRGPTGDGRFKPDVVAPGSHITSLARGTASGYALDWDGTSMATPHVTGLAATLKGRYDWPAWVIRAIIQANAINLGYARNTQGLGKVDALRTHYGWGGSWYSWWWNNGGTGDLRYVDLTLGSSVSHLRVVLVYPDPPAASGASSALVNDLDLYVQTGTLTTDLGYNWRSISALNNVEVVDIFNAPAGTYRFKVYTYSQNSGSFQNWAITAAWSNGSTSPNVNVSLSVPYAVQPNTAFYAQGYASPSSYVASGVYGQISLLSGGTSLDGLWYNRRGKPSSNEEWIWYPNPNPGTADWYSPFGMNQGNIGAGLSRTLWWQVRGTTEGVKTLRYAIRSRNGGSTFVDQNVIVDGTLPTLHTITSQNWGPDLKPDVTCLARDTLAGLHPAYAYYRYSTDGGATWSAWINTPCTGAYGTTATQTITAYDVPFGQNSAALNQIQFGVYDAAWNWSVSAVASISTPVVTKITFTPNAVAGGLNTTGKVTLSGAAPIGGAVVLLSNGNPKASMPATVTVPAGASSVTFVATTTPVTATTSGTVSATYGGVTKSVVLKVRPIGVKLLKLSPNPVVGPNPSTGTVVLELPVPASIGTITVLLSSNNPAVAKPAVGSLTFTTGQDTKTFTVNTATVLFQQSAKITAKGPGSSKSVTLKVNP